jgi:hypothetical protein
MESEMKDVLTFVGVVTLIIASIVCAIALPILTLGDIRVPDIKQHAAQVLSANGFEVIGYQGYTYGLSSEFGGCVWYTMKKGNVTYEGCVTKWGNEYHIYSLKALDAIKPH